MAEVTRKIQIKKRTEKKQVLYILYVNGVFITSTTTPESAKALADNAYKGKYDRQWKCFFPDIPF